jgi:hypothetical protein
MLTGNEGGWSVTAVRETDIDVVRDDRTRKRIKLSSANSDITN